MIRRLEEWLNLRPGEARKGGLLFAYLFLVIGSFVVGKAVRDALFLDRFSALQLPYVDIAIALIVGVWVSVYLRLGRYLSVRMLLVGSLLVFAGIALLFWWLAQRTDSPWLFRIIYVWVGMFGVVAPAQVWTLANYVLTTREAKRLFGFIGSGATLGWIVGGFIVRLTAMRYGSEASLVGMAVALFISAALVDRIWALRAPDQAAVGEDTLIRRRAAAGLAESLRLIAGSRYLQAIAAVILISSFATAVAGWQFKAMVQQAIPGRDELARFFGTFNFFAGILALLVQWILTGRLLRRLGLGFALFIVPVAMTMSSFAVLLFGSLAAVIALRGCDQVLRYAIDKPTVELLYLPVPPEQTLSVKSFIDTVIWRLGDGLAGVAVLLLAAELGFSAIGITWFNLVLLVAWIAAAWVAQRLYVRHLAESIHTYRLNAERGTSSTLERTATELLVGRLKGNDPREIVYALNVFRTTHGNVPHPAVRGLLNHASPEVRTEALRVLDEAGDASLVTQVERMLYDEALAVRTHALLYLAHHAHIDPLDRVEQLGGFADFSVRSAIVSYLAQPGPTQKLDAARPILEAMITDPQLETRVEAGRVLEVLPADFGPQAGALLDSRDVEPARHAIRAVGRWQALSLADKVVAKLAEPALVEDTVEALARFNDRIIEHLRDSMADPSTPLTIRRELPSVLVRIDTPRAQQLLLENLLDPDTTLRFRIIGALNKFQDLHPTWPLDSQLLETVLAAEITGHYRSYQLVGSLDYEGADAEPIAQALRDSMNQEVERIFRLTKLLFPALDMHSAYVGLQSTNRVIHDNSLEFLDSALKPEIRALLVPLLDADVSVPRRVELANRVLGTSVASPEAAVAALMATNDPWLKSCAAYAIGIFRLTNLASALDEYLESDDTLLRETARQAKEKLAVERRPSAS
jgi:ATP:ADP antiporter, AAA family